MNAKKQILLQRIHEQLKKRKDEILNHLPVFHEIEDGIAIRFFSNWEMCEENTKIRYKRIDCDVDGEIMYNFFIPKGTYLDIRKRDNVGCIICLDGHLVLEVDDELVVLTSHTKRCLTSDIYHGRALKDSYVLTRAQK